MGENWKKKFQAISRPFSRLMTFSWYIATTKQQSSLQLKTTTMHKSNTLTSTSISFAKSFLMVPSPSSTAPQTTWQWTFSPSPCPNGRSQHMFACLSYVTFEGECQIQWASHPVHQRTRPRVHMTLALTLCLALMPHSFPFILILLTHTCLLPFHLHFPYLLTAWLM